MTHVVDPHLEHAEPVLKADGGGVHEVDEVGRSLERSMHRGFRAEHGVVLHANVVALAVRQIGDVETHAEVGAVFGAKLRAASGEHGEVVLVRISEVGVEPGVKLDGDRVWYAAVPEAAAALAEALLAKILDDEGKSVAASSSARARGVVDPLARAWKRLVLVQDDAEGEIGPEAANHSLLGAVPRRADEVRHGGGQSKPRLSAICHALRRKRGFRGEEEGR